MANAESLPAPLGIYEARRLSKLVSLQPVCGHLPDGGIETSSCHSSIGPSSDWEGAMLLLCRLFGYRPEVFAVELVGCTTGCWLFGGANGASARCFVVSGYCTCNSISWLPWWHVSCYWIGHGTSESN